jgi:hypothetical protein
MTLERDRGRLIESAPRARRHPAMFRIRTIAWAGLLLAGTAIAGEHPAYKPTKVSGISSYKGKNEVGNWLFTMKFVEPSVKSPPAGLDKLSFENGSPPGEWWARSYFPCTLKEAAATIQGEYRNLRLGTQVYLDGKQGHGFFMPVEKEHFGPTWNTVSLEGKELNDQLKELGPGMHELILWRQLDFELKKIENGKPVWKAASITLAKGKLPIEVK